MMPLYADCCPAMDDAQRRGWVVARDDVPAWRMPRLRVPIRFCPWCGKRMPEAKP